MGKEIKARIQDRGIIDMPEEIPNFFIQQHFDMALKHFKYTIMNASFSDYTKSYEAYKRTQNIIKYFKNQIIKKKPPVKIVDIGCGNGHYIFLLNWLFKLNNKAHFYGVDLSSLDIYFAEALKKSLNMDNITFEVGDAENFRLPDNSFDFVICSELIEHIVQPADWL